VIEEATALICTKHKCSLAGGQVRDDRPIDGIDQTDLLLGGSDRGRRDALLTFVGPELVAVRWKQFCTYESDPREEHNIGAQYE
jgi:hypothetical protein